MILNNFFCLLSRPVLFYFYANEKDKNGIMIQKTGKGIYFEGKREYNKCKKSENSRRLCMKILVSACLLGLPCRYDGKSKPCEKVMELQKEHELIPVCPEIYGGLPTPRPPAERQGERVVNQIGEDVTAQYRRGGECALELARQFGCRHAVLKAKSPSCGKGRIKNGRFDGGLTEGNGVAAQMLMENGVSIWTEEETDKLKIF